MAKLLLFAAGCAVLGLAAAGTDEDGVQPDGVEALHTTNFDLKMFNGSAWLVEFYAPWCPRCKQMAPVLSRVSKNLAEESDDDLSYAVANLDAETDFSLGLRFMVMQYPTVYAVCGRHVMEIKKRGADGIMGEMHAFGINHCRASNRGAPFFPPTDVDGVKRLLNPANPMSAWHTILYMVLGLLTTPLSFVSTTVTNFVILSAVAMFWLMPVVVPIVGLLVHYCDGDDEPAAPAAAAATGVQLSIGGMTCGGCQANVKKALEAVEGVSSVTVELGPGSAVVTGTATAEALIAAVEAKGKTASLAKAAAEPKKDK